MKKLILLIILYFFITYGFSQSVIKGKITDNETGEKIPNVNISLNKNIGTVSDVSGNYSISDISNGKYEISVSYIGYEKIVQKIEISENKEYFFDFKLIKSDIETEEVVISATKTYNYVKNIPARIDIIKPVQIELTASQTVDDYLSSLSGVMVNKTFGIFSTKSQVTMRGFSGKDQGRVLMLVDGIPSNKADGGSVNWNLINSDNIERIEVVKGPGSSLYGGNAMGGFINVITKKPTEKFSGNVGFEYGTFNTLAGKIFLSGRLSDEISKGFYWNLNGFYRQSDGYITQPQVEIDANPYIVPSNLKELATSAKVGYDFNKNNNIEVDFLYYDDNRGTGETVYQEYGNKTEHDTYQAKAKYSGSKNNMNWDLNIFYQSEDYKKVNEYKKDDYVFYKVLSNRVDFGALTSFSVKLGNFNILTTGFDAKQGYVDAEDVYYTSTDIVYNAGKMNTLGYYAQDELTLFSEKLKIIGGFRIDYAKYFDGSFRIESPSGETAFMKEYNIPQIAENDWLSISPKLSVQYRFTPNLRLYTAYGKGFRPSPLEDLCRSGRMKGGFKIANPNLEPEYIDNVEIGTDIEIFKNFDFSATAYYSRVEDYLYYVNSGDSIDMGFAFRPINIPSNISDVEIYGAETEIKYEPVENMFITANYSFAHSQIKEYIPYSSRDTIRLSGKYISDVPAHLFNFSVFWKNKIVDFSTNFKYISEIWVNDMNIYDEIVLSDKYPSYYTIDAKISKEFFNYLQISITAQNILDKKFYDSKMLVCHGRFITAEIKVKF